MRKYLKENEERCKKLTWHLDETYDVESSPIYVCLIGSRECENFSVKEKGKEVFVEEGITD